MNDAALMPETQKIMVDQVFPHPPETIWQTLTNSDLMGRWMMAPTGFEPVVGKQFTFQTTPAGAWDGIIHCRVLEVKRDERLAIPGGAETKAMSDTALRSTPSSPGPCPGSRTERACGSSIPASSCRGTRPPTRA